jgi:drug/metabolite transporter (DMT)-like permease
LTEVALGLFCLYGWGTADYLIARTSRALGPLVAMFSAHGLGLALLLVLVALTGQTADFQTLLGSSAALWLALAGLLRAGGMALFYTGIDRSPAGLITAVSAAYPLVVVAVGLGLAFESLAPLPALGAALVFAGVAILLFGGVARERTTGRRPGDLLAVGYGLASALGWGLALSILAYAVPQVHWLQAVTLEQLVLVVLTGLWLLVARPKRPPAGEISAWAGILVVGILEVAPLMAVSYGARTGSALVIVAIGAAYPLVTSMLAHLFLGERLTRDQVLAVFLAVAGVVILGLRAL